MNQRPEDLTDDELRALCNELTDRIDALDNDSDGAPDALVEQWAQANREESRRDALAARKAGRYSVTLDADGQEIEYELRATNEADAKVEVESGVEAMSKVSGMTVTVKQINGPITE
ncbi:hypothetical protein [Modicisalibacter xianhensis]|uniref:Uncharacterized protein n=1 Tax=Modicisalibacter xianhensis TaxID=442341 RepID=A0A1I3GAL2_9GAMM|nr:hypothetical protein [Halomonas xianhensis]SFI20493.1 hypothetical protein SAMN04487959_1292 [Halomonas xianhensis]